MNHKQLVDWVEDKRLELHLLKINSTLSPHTINKKEEEQYEYFKELSVLLKYIEKLEEAVLLDIQEAYSQCGGDGQGCAHYRSYYDNAERRHRKCQECPMDALLNSRTILDRKRL